MKKISDDNVQKEHLLTDIVKIANKEKASVSSIAVSDPTRLKASIPFLN